MIDTLALLFLIQSSDKNSNIEKTDIEDFVGHQYRHIFILLRTVQFQDSIESPIGASVLNPIIGQKKIHTSKTFERTGFEKFLEIRSPKMPHVGRLSILKDSYFLDNRTNSSRLGNP